ncbi:hypothetical protein ACFC6U_36575 [Kitasatospora purpeofusca]|uniref:hypothetical protein n=1 Tax=Kitasatospora purpeofusca TaxID=67352 RepID=UPI0035D7A09B
METPAGSAPAVPPEQQITEDMPVDGVRHAFWTASVPDGRTQYELYGFTVHDDGTAVGAACMWNELHQLAWALHAWRSVRRDAE